MRHLLTVFVFLFIVTGCATQPLTWQKTGALDISKGCNVKVAACCKMPQRDIEYLQSDIQREASAVLQGSKDAPDAYDMTVKITKYDKGNAFARFMLIGLGQMYLDGTVDIQQGNPPVLIRQGQFKKNFCLGGIAGGLATMEKDMLPKVSESVSEALRK